MAKTVRISETVLDKAFTLLNGYYISMVQKVDTARRPETAQKYREKAKQIEETIEAICVALEKD